jgi:hypothetical protein
MKTANSLLQIGWNKKYIEKYIVDILFKLSPVYTLGTCRDAHIAPSRSEEIPLPCPTI